MNETLKKIGITTEERYECIYTTIDEEGNKNSAAIGLKYFGSDNIGCRIFEGSKTLENIQKTKKYVINITQDPLIFTKSTIDKLSDEYFTDDSDIAILKDAGSYIIVDVVDINEQKPENTPIDNDQSIFMIKGKISKIVINDESIKAYCRLTLCIRPPDPSSRETYSRTACPNRSPYFRTNFPRLHTRG